MENKKLYGLVANLFQYPDSSSNLKAKRCLALLKQSYPDAAVEMEKFAVQVKDIPIHQWEEIYTKTFHIQAICYLDLGYVLFGEDYKRGEFLVNMKKEQDAAGMDCGIDLADNLSNVLRLIPEIQSHEFKDELCARVIIPSLDKMLDEFRSARMTARVEMLKKKHNAVLQENQSNGNIYRHLLKALQLVMLAQFGHIQYEEVKPDPKEALQRFITGCGSCSIPNLPTQNPVS